MRLIIDIKVSDLDRAVRFYAEMLGLVCRRQEKDWAAIAIGDAEIHLYLDRGVTGSIEFYVDDIDTKVQEFTERGVVFIPGTDKPSAVKVDENGVTEFPWGRMAFFRDSEGNELALVQDFI